MPRTKSFDEQATLDMAKELFWAKGYNGTPPQDILDSTGLSRSSLYDTYGDKHSLFLKTLRRYRHTQTAAAIRFLDSAADPAHAIRKFFYNMFDGIDGRDPRRGCFMLNSLTELASHDREVAAIIRENRKALESAFVRAVKRGQQSGCISKAQSPAVLGRYLISSLWGLTISLKLGLDKKSSNDIVRTTLSIL